MDKKELIIGIDFTQEYSKVCYFSEKHAGCENVIAPGSGLGLLIPSVLSYDSENGRWLLGGQAKEHALKTGSFIYNDLLTKALSNESYEINGQIFSGTDLFAVFLKGLINLARSSSGIYPVFCVNIAMRRINSDIKEMIEQVLSKTGIERERIHLLNYPESFAYFILQQDEELWREGARLFDFSKDGFFVNHLTWTRLKDHQAIYVNESNYSMEFSYKDVENVVLRPGLDDRLNELYEEIKGEEVKTSVYFTGSGFEELWFSKTLENISSERRAFRGNNIYAKGACLLGLLRKEDVLDQVSVICRPKTKASISVEARKKGVPSQIVLSPAAVNWYEASGSADFILDDARMIEFKITSLMSRQEAYIPFNLSIFPLRPSKTTRVRVSARYINEYECEICVKDLGFGELYPAGSKEVRKILDLEGYI